MDIRWHLRRPKQLAARGRQAAESLAAFRRGYQFGRRFQNACGAYSDAPGKTELEEYFDAHTEGPGLWKWRHYFEIYDRHFARFRGKEVHVLEIGIYSGGSLGLWRSYFGESAHLYGVDIEPVCRAYEREGMIRVFIGDQADPNFWRSVINQVPRLDIVIDDGGHLASQQIPTLEAVLPHLAPGGVFLCEDIHGGAHPFHSYVDGLSRKLHVNKQTVGVTLKVQPCSFQQMIHSVHSYPFVTVFEKRTAPVDLLEAPKHGTEWEPFLDVPLPPIA